MRYVITMGWNIPMRFFNTDFIIQLLFIFVLLGIIGLTVLSFVQNLIWGNVWTGLPFADQFNEPYIGS